MEICDFKKKYSVLAKKYGLPRFEELNENFEIERIEDETEILLKMIRKVMMEKVVNSLNFVEMLMNPMNAPRMYYGFLKAVNGDDKKSLEKLYGELAALSVFAMEREIEYNEKGEAEVISAICKVWKGLAPDFNKIIARIKTPGNSVGRERSYFG